MLWRLIINIFPPNDSKHSTEMNKYHSPLLTDNWSTGMLPLLLICDFGPGRGQSLSEARSSSMPKGNPPLIGCHSTPPNFWGRTANQDCCRKEALLPCLRTQWVFWVGEWAHWVYIPIKTEHCTSGFQWKGKPVCEACFFQTKRKGYNSFRTRFPAWSQHSDVLLIPQLFRMSVTIGDRISAPKN